MLKRQQKQHFDTFGFLLLKQAFDAGEIAAITRTVEEVWAQEPPSLENEERRANRIVERRPELTRLVTDERIYPVVAQLLGLELQWVGSEGNVSSRTAVGWHPDRKYYLNGETHWMDFAQIKVMMYLDSVGRDSGCLRVIPGSHRMPLHQDLAEQELDPASRPFGLDGHEIPCAKLESEPGDVILFNHCLWHAAFGGSERRRYLAMKFSQRPTAAHHVESLRKYGTGVFAPHETFTHHDDPRIRAMVRIPA